MSVVAWLRDFTADEEASATAVDKSGTGNSAWFDGGAAFELLPGKGRVIHFPEGVPGKIVMNDSASLDIVGAITIGVRFTKYSIDEAALVDKGNAYRLRFEDSSMVPTFGLYISGAWVELSPANPLLVERDYYLEATYDGNDMTLYANGAVIATQPASGVVASNSSPVTVGDLAAGGMPLDGHVDEVLIRDSATNLAQHKIDTLRGRTSQSETIIELLDINLGSGSLHFTTYHEPINVRVKN